MKDARPEWFKQFLKNDWRHLNWKMNAILIILSGIVISVVAKFITG